MSVKRFQDVTVAAVAAGERTYKQVLISATEAPHFAMRRFIIEAGGYMPLHSNSVEHEQLCLGGEAEVIIGDETVRVKQHDVIFIPAGVAHAYRTVGDQSFEFLCLIPNEEDIVTMHLKQDVAEL